MVTRPFIIPIFIPHMGCPHRCVFCNQQAITGASFDLDTVPSIIDRGVQSRKRSGRPAQVAFYGGNFSSLPQDLQGRLLGFVQPYLDRGEVDSVRISTRPDAAPPETLVFLKQHGVTTIELGVQSIDSDVLRLSERGHGPEVVYEAAGAIKDQGFKLGLQLMVGLPGDTPSKARATGREAVKIAPDMVRIYPTLVIKGSKLARLYQDGLYRPLGLDEAVSLCADLVELFGQANVAVIRVGLQETEFISRGGEVLAGPHHPAMGQLVKSALWLRKIEAQIQCVSNPGASLSILAAPNEISDVRGHKNSNIDTIRRRFSFSQVRVGPDPSLQTGEMRLEY